MFASPHRLARLNKFLDRLQAAGALPKTSLQLVAMVTMLSLLAVGVVSVG